MPITIRDRLLSVDGAGDPVPVVGAAVSLYPVTRPFFFIETGEFYDTQMPFERSVVSDGAGWFEVVGARESEGDPADAQWQLKLPNGEVWQGPLPDDLASPASLMDLKDAGWNIVNANSIYGPVSAVITGPRGSKGDTGATADPLDPSPAGSYTNLNATVDAFGRVTAAASGSAGDVPSSRRIDSVSGETSGGGDFSANRTIGLATLDPSPAGTYAYPSSATVDAKGRVTAVTAGSAPLTTVSILVPEFYGDNGWAHINHGPFWQPATNLGKCYWEAWVRCADGGGSRYWLADGWGGKHCILAGVTQAGAGQILKPSGNMWTGATSVGWVTDDGVLPDEWHHVAFWWDQALLGVHINGVCVGRIAHTGTRQSGTVLADAGTELFAGGPATHATFMGRIAQIRGFEGLPDASNFFPLGFPLKAFNPERIFGNRSYDVNTGTWTNASFFCNYLNRNFPSQPDGSPAGYRGTWHDGNIHGGGNGPNRGFPNGAVSTFPQPTWVVDSGSPFGASPTIPAGYLGGAVPAAPVGARVWDPFVGKPQSVPAFHPASSLGNTASGSGLTVSTWQAGAPGVGAPTPRWGIFNGWARYYGTTVGNAWVETGSADMDVRIKRRKSTASPGQVGICFRVNTATGQGRDNYAYAIVYVSGVNTISRIGRYYAGVHGPVDGAGGFLEDLPDTGPAGASWQYLRVVCSGTTFTLYVDNGSGGWHLLRTVTGQTTLQANTGAGLAANSNLGSNGVNSLDAYREFAVL